MEVQNIVYASTRERLGSNAVNLLKKENKIPAAIYNYDGFGQTRHISVDAKKFNLLFLAKRLISTTHEIKLDNGAVEKFLVKDFQFCPISMNILHIDFIKIQKGLKIKAKVPLFYLNRSKSIGIKKGALLNIAKYYIYLMCDGDCVPERLEIDLDQTDVLWRFYGEHLQLPDGVTLFKANEILANYVSKRGKAIKAE